MQKWKAPVMTLAFITSSSCALLAMAQVHAPRQSAGQPALVGHKMAGTGDLPVLKLERMRFNPVHLHWLGGRLAGITRQEGDFDFQYGGNQITHESNDKNLQGRYVYDRDGRFDRIEYNDGVSITAQYGDNNELISLTSTSGRTIGFYYDEQAESPISSVTPLENSLEFHSAIAVLRMKKMPIWMGMLQEKIKLDEDPQSPTPAGTTTRMNGKTSAHHQITFRGSECESESKRSGNSAVLSHSQAETTPATGHGLSSMPQK